MKRNKQASLHQRRTRSEQKTIRRNLLRKLLSLALLLLCAFPMLGGGIQPLWVIPAAICISMNEDMYFCMAAGVLSGFLIDIACGSPLGINAIFMVIFCTFVCLLFEQILRRNFWYYILLTAVCVLFRNGLSWLLTYGIYRTEGNSLYWHDVLLPSALLTIAVAVAVYLLYMPLTRLLTKRVRSMDAAAIRHDW
ncbi:MAG: rod shape-determining protein MreD [Oscillospiraceae bacterium]|nr:rod shape-determining protein MreD [Oscillospiraceae bacterium]